MTEDRRKYVMRLYVASMVRISGHAKDEQQMRMARARSADAVAKSQELLDRIRDKERRRDHESTDPSDG